MMTTGSAAPRASQFGLSRAPQPALALGVMLAMAGLKLLLHAALSGHYGYFRDELYYIDLAHHLAPGYVDCAPLIAFYTRLALLLGGSLPALRLLPALASAGTVALTMYIAWQLGGGRYAQFFAGFCILINPGRLML